MAYFRTYTATFFDIHNTHPAKWRVDILDDQANGDDMPINLQLSGTPLILERIDTSDDKATIIIGQQAIFEYIYTGKIDDPLPELFFDIDERRFRMEVYKNDILYEVFYIKPDAQSYQDKLPPYNVTLTAVDGLSFIKTVPWNAYTDGLLDYRWMSLYEIIAERGLLQILDTNTAFNVVNTLRPDNIEGNETFLNDLYVHSDLFYDFTKGPNMIYDVLEKICQAFNCRLFISQNQVWIIRISDLNETSIISENYISGIMNTLPLPTINRTIGQNISGNDAIPIGFSANNLSFSAVKKVRFELKYKAINQLSNFDWSIFDGSSFNEWAQSIAGSPQRAGSGTINDPYTARLLYTTDINTYISQNISASVSTGDIVQFSIPYYWTNTNYFRVVIFIDPGISDPAIFLNGDGTWTQTPDGTDGISVGRSGKKRNGNIDIKSMPAPIATGLNKSIVIRIYYPTRITYHIPPEDGDFKDDPLSGDYVDILPVSLGISPIPSNGRQITDINNARFSKEKDIEEFFLMDTGIIQISNTISISDSGMAAKNWASNLTPSNIDDLERHMSDGIIDQYAVSVRGWESDVKSNTIQFWHIFTMDNKPGKKYITMRDKYEVKGCIHDIGLQNILAENGAETTYSEIDIEDSE